MTSRVVVIGGGIVGCGIARDLAFRGVSVVVIEQGSVNRGTSGHSHGVLHSGARYVDTDPEVARDCYAENQVLKRIAAGCVSETDGYFVSLDADDPAYFDRKRSACSDCGIPTVVQTDRDLESAEPGLADDTVRGFRVPDGVVFPSKLVAATMASAISNGADLVAETKVTDIHATDGQITGVSVRSADGVRELTADHVVNAAGPWVGKVAALAGGTVGVTLSQGTMVVIEYGGLGSVINRCRPPSDGDIVVPHQSCVVAGTTSQRVTSPDHESDDPAGIDRVVSETGKLIPAIPSEPVMRSYQGIRALVPADQTNPREYSRGFSVVDHGETDEIMGLTSVVGGKVTTYRLIAEAVSDHIADVIGIRASCRTENEVLPGMDDSALLQGFVDEFSTGTVASI